MHSVPKTLPASEEEETRSEKSQVHALLISGGLLRGEDLRDKRNGKVCGGKRKQSH